MWVFSLVSAVAGVVMPLVAKQTIGAPSPEILRRNPREWRSPSQLRPHSPRASGSRHGGSACQRACMRTATGELSPYRRGTRWSSYSRVALGSLPDSVTCPMLAAIAVASGRDRVGGVGRVGWVGRIGQVVGG